MPIALIRFTLLYALLMSVSTSGAETVDVGGARQLLFDDRIIEGTSGTVVSVNPPELVGIVLTPDKPWESATLSYFNVMEDQGLYKMWYGCYEAISFKRRICYATSTDGLSWEKPNLGLVEYQGSYNNNILPVEFDDGGAIFIDPLAPPESRYKILGNRIYPFIYESSDGINFNLIDTALLDMMADSHNLIFFDDRIDRYVAYIRSWNFLPEYDSAKVANRTVSRLEIVNPEEPWEYVPIDSPLYLWGPEKPPAISTEFDIVLHPDSLDPPNIDIYNPCINKYIFAEDTYFAFPSIYSHYPNPPEGDFYNDGILNIQIAASRDGLDWIRYRTPYIDHDFSGDSLRQMYMALGMLLIDDYIYQFFNGLEETHGDSVKTSSYYCVRQRLDRFISLRSEDEAGNIITKTVQFEGNTLHLNCSTGADGYILVELRDENNSPLPGHTLNEADTLRGDSIDMVAAWDSNIDIGIFQAIPVKMYISLYKAALFSLQFQYDPGLDVIISENHNMKYSLEQNHPNPFNAVTRMEFSLPARSHVNLTIYDILGHKITELARRIMPAGTHTVTWDGTDMAGKPVSTGVYLYQLKTGDIVETKKMILLK